MKATLRLPKERLDALVPAAVEAYLRAHGWEDDPAVSSADVGVYHSSAVPEAEVLVPRNPGFSDYALRVSEVLQALAAMERRTAWEVSENLSARRAESRPRTAPSPGRGEPAVRRWRRHHQMLPELRMCQKERQARAFLVEKT